MWFVVILCGMLLVAAIASKWIDANVKIKKILAEELRNYDDQDNLDDR